MKNSMYVYVVISIFIFSSCENILEEKPTGFITSSEYYNTECEIEAAIYGVYNYLNITGIAEAEWMFIGDAGTDVQRTRDVSRYSYQFAIMDITPSEYSDYWKQYYQAVGAANSVISRVSVAESISDDFKVRIIAEAKFLRAFYYHHLSLIWGNVPMWLDELNLDEVENLGNESAANIRKQVIQDLNDAITGLPTTVSQSGRVTSWVAKGLLARVYLFDEQWQNAKDIAKDVIDNSPHSLEADVMKLFDWKNKSNKEMMHFVPKKADIKPSTLHSSASPRPFDDNNFIVIPQGESIIRPDGKLTTDVQSRNPGSLFQGWGMYQCLEEHYNSFDTGDTRRDLWWHQIQFTNGSTYTFDGGGSVSLPGHSGYYALKWIAWDENANNGGRDTYLQRLAELYLIYAEAENELNGPTTEAYKAINTIRRRAFGNNNHDLSGLTKDEFRKAIITENRWELGGEGLRRWYLWHWGYDVYLEAAQSIIASNPNLANNLKSHHQYFKIPDTEISKNPNLIQNSGY